MKIIILSILMLLLASCTSNTQITSNHIPEMQDDETTDHMSVVGQTNQFLSIVGTKNNVSIRTKDIR